MKYTLICLLLSTQTVLAQWSLGVSATPMTSSPFTSDSYVTPKGGPSYKLSLNASYAVSDRFLVSSGLQYSFKTVIWEDNVWVYTFPLDDGGIATRAYHVKVTERYRSIELPIRCSYMVASLGRSSFRISAGVFAGLAYEREHEYLEDDWVSRQKDVHGLFIGGATAGVEYQYLFSHHLGLSLTPYYSYERYARELYALETALPLAFHSFGVESGIFIRLD